MWKKWSLWISLSVFLWRKHDGTCIKIHEDHIVVLVHILNCANHIIIEGTSVVHLACCDVIH